MFYLYSINEMNVKVQLIDFDISLIPSSVCNITNFAFFQIDKNCEIVDDKHMLLPNGIIKISRVLTVQHDQTSLMELGVLGIVAQRHRSGRVCLFSRRSYGRLNSYIAAMRAGASR